MAEHRPRDTNALAARVVAEATGQAEKTEPPDEDEGERTPPVAPRSTRSK